MDVLKPQLFWLNGRCFRVPYSTTASSNDDLTLKSESRDVQEYEEEGDYEGSSDDETVLVETTAAGRLQTILHVPQMFFGCIIGPRGETRKIIEAETGTDLKIPRNKTDCGVVITGQKRNSVLRARRRLLLKIASFRLKQTPTHFLSIPMTGKEIQNSVLKFKEEICKNPSCTTESVEPALFRSPEKLHLTLGMMVLGDDYEVNQVNEMLQNFKDITHNPVLHGKPLEVNMQGVEYMNDDPSNVDILYGRVQTADGSNNLQSLADELFTLFKEKGFITERRRDNVKLHVTLMNTKFRDKQEGDTKPPRRRKVDTFDARSILENYRDFDFGVQQVNSVHLSQRFTADSEGYYKMVAKMKI